MMVSTPTYLDTVNESEYTISDVTLMLFQGTALMTGIRYTLVPANGAVDIMALQEVEHVIFSYRSLPNLDFERITNTIKQHVRHVCSGKTWYGQDLFIYTVGRAGERLTNVDGVLYGRVQQRLKLDLDTQTVMDNKLVLLGYTKENTGTADPEVTKAVSLPDDVLYLNNEIPGAEYVLGKTAGE